MILKFLLNTQIIWTLLIKILKNKIQIKNKKILIVFDDAITDMLSNKNRNPIVTELFTRGRKHLEHFFCFLSHNLTILYQKMFD